MIENVINGAKPGAGWGAWQTACLTEFATENPEHPVNKRLEVKPIFGKAYNEKFDGGRANPANYTYPVIGSKVKLDGIQLP